MSEIVQGINRGINSAVANLASKHPNSRRLVLGAVGMGFGSGGLPVDNQGGEKETLAQELVKMLHGAGIDITQEQMVIGVAGILGLMALAVGFHALGEQINRPARTRLGTRLPTVEEDQPRDYLNRPHTNFNEVKQDLLDQGYEQVEGTDNQFINPQVRQLGFAGGAVIKETQRESGKYTVLYSKEKK